MSFLIGGLVILLSRHSNIDFAVLSLVKFLMVKLNNSFFISLILISNSCGGIDLIQNTNIDKPRFYHSTNFVELPNRIKEEYLSFNPAIVINGIQSLNSYESVLWIKENKTTDTLALLWVNREFWTFGLGGMPSRNNKGHVLKSGFHFEYKGNKFYLRDNRDGLPLIIMNDSLYIYDSYKNNFEYPYSVNQYGSDLFLDDLKVIVISLKKWL
ncbi:MAG: hypothetical protein AAF806_09785 [Bacteroidota bacterium]